MTFALCHAFPLPSPCVRWNTWRGRTHSIIYLRWRDGVPRHFNHWVSLQCYRGSVTIISLLGLIKPVSNVRPSVRPQKVYSISVKLGYVGRGPRSRSRALESRKFDHLQTVSPPPFVMGAGKWPRILKLGHNAYRGRIFDIFAIFCATWLWSWQ